MKTIMIRLLLALILLQGCAIALDEAHAQPVQDSKAQKSTSQSGLFDDQRLRAWSSDFLAGRKPQVEKAVAADLSAASPHPFAAYVWVRLQESLGRSREQTVQRAPEKSRPSIDLILQVDALNKATRYDEMINLVPPEKVPEQINPWTLAELAAAAESAEMHDMAFAYRLAYWERYPEMFGPVWEFIDYLSDKEFAGFRNKLLERTVPAAAKGQLSSRWLARIASDRGLQGPDQLQIALSFGQNDWHALRFAGAKAAGLGRWKESEDWRTKADLAFPFRNNGVRIAVSQLRQRQFDKALKTIQQHAPLYAPSAAAAELQVHKDWVEALDEAGERGKQRAALEQAFAKWPGELNFKIAMAKLEASSGRHSDAADHWREVTKAAPQDPSAWAGLINALRESGESQEALDAFQQAIDAGVVPGVNLTNAMLDTMQKLNKHADVVRLAQAELKKRPLSTWTMRNAALSSQKLGQQGPAVDWLKRSFEVELTNWGLARYAELTGDAGMDALHENFPHSSAIVDAIETQIGDNKDRSRLRRAVDRALAKGPTMPWPYFYRAWEAMKENQADATLEWIAKGLTAMPADLPGRKATLLLNQADLIRRLATDASAAAAAMTTQGISALAQADALGGDLARVHELRYYLHLLRSEGDAALRNLTAWQKDKPDLQLPVALMMRFEMASPSGEQFVALSHHIDRNPYDKVRLEDGIHYHARWGGSPLISLAYLREYSRLFPTSDRRGWLEDNANEAMESTFGIRPSSIAESGRGVGNSDRYIAWFESKRLRAQGDSNFLLPEKLDLRQLRATVVTPDGIEMEKGYHRVSGKPTYVRVGRAFITAQYDADGLDLQELRNSSGEGIVLRYDEKRQITKMTASGGADLSFEYAPNGKPSKIVVKEVGSIDVQYDEQGEIDKVESSGGPKIALTVTRSFQDLLGHVQAFKAASSAAVQDLPFEDPALLKLKDLENPSQPKTSLAVARYLVDHIGDRLAYATEAEQRLDGLVERAHAAKTAPEQLAGIEALTLWHRLTVALHPHGVAASAWADWQGHLTWLDSLSGRNAALVQKVAALRSDISKKPIQLLPTARWLPKSYVDNPGFWHRYLRHQVLPAGKDESMRAVSVRRNGHVVIGTASGLSVQQRGFWEPMFFDPDRRLFVTDKPASPPAAVNCITEDAAGRLWVGTENGLILLAGGYDEPARRWVSKAAGLSSPRITALASFGDGMLVGTPEGLRYFTTSGAQALPAALKPLNATPIALLRPFGDEAKQSGALIGTDTKLLEFRADALKDVAAHVVQDAIVHDNRLFTLRQNEVQVRQRQVNGQWQGAERVADHVNIVNAKQINGFATIVLDDRTQALSVLTDSGIAIYADYHFEFKKMPGADRDVAVFGGASGSEKTVLLTGDGVFLLEKTNVYSDTDGRVHDILASPAHKATFIARKNGLFAVSHTNPDAGPRMFKQIEATRLELLADGSLLANDGLEVLHFPKDSLDGSSLFVAQPHGPAGKSLDGHLTSLLVASDGSIWASAGASVFRYRDGKTEEFSMFLDGEKFPARSDMISRVLETVDRRIWVVASNEGHRQYRGENLEGGLLEWAGDRFIKKERTGPWFLTSYTAIDERQAIGGTNSGFAMQEGDRFDYLENIKEPSYLKLMARQPQLAMGSRGARLGQDAWLFGTPGGLVAWAAGQWVVPDRLNWLLPSQDLANYGSRMVHAVATDETGRVYAGTDRGLMIYDAGSTDLSQFLVNANLPDMAFGVAEHRKLRDEAAAFVQSAPPTTPVGKLIEDHAQSARKLADLREKKAQPSPLLSQAPATGESKAPDNRRREVPPDLDARLAEQERAHKALLASLEKDAFGLYQMLELKPIDLAVWRKRLPENAVVVQYLPTHRKLMIHIASQKRSEVREVSVPSDELFLRSLAVSEALAISARQLQGGDRGLSVISKGTSPSLLAKALVTKGPEAIQDELHWLYEQLLRPIEREIAEYQHVYLSPVGALAHVPFGALVRSRSESGVEYAVQRYRIGVLPSLYLLDLVLRDQATKSGVMAVFGNPDGTLPGAEKEAVSIQAITGKDTVIRLGSDVSIASLRHFARNARWLHLATHGVLNGSDPTKSYLIMGKGEKLSMLDAMTLPLEHTETVVLSACETGAGVTGLDYATLSRAFSYAGAPSVIASLWKVHDGATAELMSRFYKHRQEGKDVFLALAVSQADLIARGGPYSTPEAWSGFMAFGRP